MPPRKKLVAGNWKMNQAQDGASQLATIVCDGVDARTTTEILVCPAFVHLATVGAIVNKSPWVKLGAQDVSVHDNGAYTGETSCAMLVDMGCSHVIVGHSERRQYHGESSELVAQKAQKALDGGLIPIVCVGETLEQREADNTEQVIGEQVSAALELLGINAYATAIIAYEPVWAIGTGITATPEQAQSVHAFIRSLLSERDAQVAGTTQILYGGSVKPDNAQILFGQPDIDGGLIGGAALNAIDFLAIINAAEHL